MKRFALVPGVSLLVAATLSGWSAAAAAATPAALLAGPNMKLGNPPSKVKIAESGSSLLAPYLSRIAPQVTKAYPNITFSPAAGGSGKGISDAIAGVSQMGGSDAYLPPATFQANKTILNIPIAVSSQSVDYNLKGIKHLKLSGNVVAQIYEGKITKWNAAPIAKMNKGVKLPNMSITPVVRSDSSGDTFIFTSFLTATNNAWKDGPAFNTTVKWPSVSNELTASGNPAMVEAAGKRPGAIAYVGISAQGDANKAGLNQAMLQNASGKFVLPQANNVTASVNALKNVPGNLAASLIYMKGNDAYPIVNFEYLIVKPPQPANIAQGIRDILAFAINPKQGSSKANLSSEGFVALPKSVVPKVQAAIAKVS